MTKYRACANTPALSRRNVLGGLTALPATCSLPFSVQAAEHDPVMPLYHEWRAARREWHRLAELHRGEMEETPEMLAACDREFAAENAILSETATTLEGIAAIATMAWCYDGPFYTDPDEYEAQAQSVECRRILAIWRACTGQDGYPVT